MNQASLIIKTLLEKNYSVPNISFDNQLIRFDRDGVNNAYFVGRTYVYGEKKVLVAIFGDWKTGENLRCQTDKDLDETQKKEVENGIKEAREVERRAKEARWGEVALEYEKAFANFRRDGSCPYLVRKGLGGLFGARLQENPNGDPIIIVPLRDANGKLWNYQRIYSQKLSKGDKFFQPDGKIEGCFHTLHRSPNENDFTPIPTKEVYICEGFATAASVLLALGPESTVLCAFNAGNLRPVAESVRKQYPDVKIIICADNDHATLVKGKPDNVGIRYGRAAAGAVLGELRYPKFRTIQKGFTDFNDLHAAEGLEKVKDQLLNPGKYREGLEPMLLQTTESGAPRKPGEKRLVDYILDSPQFKDKLVKQDDMAFYFDRTHWLEFTHRQIDSAKKMFQFAAQNTLAIKDIEATYKHFLLNIPHAPYGTNLYQPNPYAANFQNGTLHIVGQSLEFKPHTREDFLTSVLPFDCPDLEETAPPTPMFDAWLERLWANDPDRLDKVKLFHQLMGACLCPAFPVIAYFVGPPATGKSTAVKFLAHLVNLTNTSQVQLSDMKDFNMDVMVNKLVNFCTEAEIHKPISDVHVKMIVDRMPFNVRRKFKTDVQAYLPAVHLMASNALPKSLDGSSQAYGRRFIIIQTDSIQLNGSASYDFEKELWDAEGPGIVRRAVEGLRELVASGGKYCVPHSSRERVKELETNSDILEQFLNEVKDGEIAGEKNGTILYLDNKQRIRASQLWEHFKDWQIGVLNHRDPMGRNSFINGMRDKGFKRVKDSVNTFVGIGYVTRGDSNF